MIHRPRVRESLLRPYHLKRSQLPVDGHQAYKSRRDDLDSRDVAPSNQSGDRSRIQLAQARIT